MILPPGEPLVFALAVDASERFLIIESSGPAHRGSDTPKVQGPMREEKLRMVLANQFRMTPEAITRSVEQARQHLREGKVDASLCASHPHEQPEVAFVERRNHTSRAARVKRLVDVVAVAVDGITLTEVAGELTPAAAERILKPLAVRGLVKVADGRWAPRDCLRAGVNLPLIPE